MDKLAFGTYIKEKRTERGLTQKELADALMIDVTAVSKWERGVNYPDITMIPDICRQLNISEHELIESSNDTEYRRIRSEARRYQKIRNGLFWSFTAAYLLAVVTCFIVNLSVNHTLSWTFPVAAGCLCGFTFVPTCLRFFKKYRLPAFAATTFLGLFLLFLTVSIYTGNYWVWVASGALLLGYFALFYPLFFVRQKAYMTETAYCRGKRFFLLTYGLGLLLLTALLLFAVNAYTALDLGLAVRITAYCFTLLLAFGLAELLPVNRLIRLGLESFCTAAYLFGLNGVLNRLLDGGEEVSAYYRVDFTDWGACSDGNVTLIVTAAFCLLGILFIGLGLARKKKP